MTTTNVIAEEALTRLADGDARILETLVAMHMDTLGRSGLGERAYHLVRLGALVAMDAAPIFYLTNLGAAVDDGVTPADAVGALVAVAPIVGSARVVAAAGNVIDALGIGDD